MKQKKRPMTLLEIMVVIFIIGIVGTVIGVNMRGSLEQGKAFKSEKGSKQVYEILNLEIAKGNIEPSDITTKKAVQFIRDSGLAPDSRKLLEDGWSKPYRILVKEDGTDVRVISDAFVRYLRNKKKLTPAKIHEKYFWMDETETREIEDGA